MILYNSKVHWKDNRYSANSGIITSIVSIVIGTFFIIAAVPVIYLSMTATTMEGIASAFNLALLLPLPYPIASFVMYFSSFVMVFILGYYVIELIRKRHVGEREEKMITVAPVDLEVARKLFHIGILGVIVAYLFIGEMVGGGIYDICYNLFQFYFGADAAYFITPVNPVYFPQLMGQATTVFIFIDILMILGLTDFIRIYDYRFYPMKELGFIYRNKERNVLGPHVYIIIGCIFAALFFPGPIAISAIAMTGFGDAMATIVGVSVGKRKIKPLGRESNKTVEGCIGGFVGSFVFGIISYWFVASKWYVGTSIPLFEIQIFVSAIVLNLIGASVFMLFDYLDPPCSDNIFNPVLISMVIFVFTLILFPLLIVYPWMIG